jgi:hypothetical protein
MHKGRLVTEEFLAELPPEKWPTEFFTPTAGQVFAAIGLIVAGFLLTGLIARLGQERSRRGGAKDAEKN